MNKLALRRSIGPAALCAGICLTGGALDTQAQLTPAQRSQLNDFFGSRAEAAVVLGASDSASSGSYTVDGRNGNEDLDFGLMKFGGGGEIGQARKLGDSGMTWNPVIMGSVGLISGKNNISVGPLRGNKIDESALGMQFGGGMALHLTERFTITPTIGMIYGHYEQDFIAHTSNGLLVKQGIEDSADTMGITPGIGLSYKIPMGKNLLDLSAHYTFYGTEDISDSEFDVGGSSHIFEQRADIDIPLSAQLFDCPLHTGGYVSLTETAGDMSDTMNSDLWATFHARLLLNTENKGLWKMDRIGLGASYIAADHFSGWDMGVEVSFKF